MTDKKSIPTSSAEITPVLAPVSARERIDTIDILRGFALIGIILVNTWAFQQWFLGWQIEYAEVWTGTADHIAMWVIEIFAKGKFFRLFSFLFGLGFAMQLVRAEKGGVPIFSVYLRRLLVLLLFGLLHIMLRGEGDILVLYAILGALLLLFRNFSPRALLVSVLLCILIPWAVDTVRDARHYDFRTAPLASASIMEGHERSAATQRARYEEIVRVRREGTLEENVAVNLRSWVRAFANTNPLDYLGYLRGEFLMFLLGLYAGRRRIFENIDANLPFFRKLMWWGLGLGVVGVSIHLTLTRVLFEPPSIPFFADRIAGLCRTIGDPAFTLFYMSAIVFLVQRKTWKKLLAQMGAVGRMPLTNYLLHTVIHVVIFYRIGLGLYGKISPAATIGVSLIMYASMMFLSVWWMNRFRFGPAEWLWRTLAYGKRQPMLLKQDAA